jgi:phosphoenolpyruvate carboxykinase (ATP)
MFFLTCDATGVLPPISKLTPAQAMYHFMSGYTAKVAGTEMGIKEPQVVFSACFGAPFMPLHPYDYAELLGQRIQEFNTRVWLINTGWTGGAYGTGHRISLDFTREMVASALNGELDDVTFVKHDVFNVDVPKMCGNIPQSILDPSKSWSDPKAYEEAAFKLADLFIDNFRKFEDKCSDAITKGGPNVLLYRDRKAS